MVQQREGIVCICGASMEAYMESGGRYERFCCRQCGLLSRGEMPSEEETLQWYRESYWKQFGQEQLGTARENVCRHVMERIITAHQSPGILVDIGCGAGALLKCGAGRGWRGIGFELSRPAVSQARSQGLEVYEQSWLPCPLRAESADAVTFLNVLDHLVRPFDALKEAWRVLRPGGQIYIRVPNGPLHDRVSRILSGCGLNHLTVMHLYGFGRRALLFHLARLGFESVDVRTSPPTQADAYGSDGKRRSLSRQFAKQMDRITYGAMYRAGLDRWGWGPSVEALARKPLAPVRER